MDTKLQKITDPNCSEVKILAALADEIWHEHFSSILSAEQIDYMLEKFQSESAMRAQLLNEGYIYYLATVNDTPAAYCAVVPKPEKTLFLSKLYVLKSMRKQGLASLLLFHALETSGDEFESVYLTCNKYNESSLAAYRHMGFSITDSVVTPIGNGMVMDDYILTIPASVLKEYTAR